MQNKTGMTTPEIARAYTIVREAFGLREMWDAIEALDNKVPAEAQTIMLRETARTLERMTLWFLRNGEHPLDISRYTDAYGAGIEVLRKKLDKLMAPDQLKETAGRAAGFAVAGVPKELAERIGHLKALSTACDIIRIADAAGRSVEEVAETYFLLGSRFRLDWLRHNANIMSPENPWYQMALGAIIEDLWGTQGELTGRILRNGGCGKTALDEWANQRKELVRRVAEIVTELEQHGSLDLAMLTVVNRELRGLVVL